MAKTTKKSKTKAKSKIKTVKKAVKVKPTVANVKAPTSTTPEPAINKGTSEGFVLERDVPVPERIRNHSARSVYPFASMTAGDSFFIPAPVIDSAFYTSEEEADKERRGECKRISNRLAGATRRFVKLNDDYKFTIRTTQNSEGAWGVRVWRVDKPIAY